MTGNSSSSVSHQRWFRRFVVPVLLVPIILALIPVGVLLGILYYLWQALLYVAIWFSRCTAGAWILFVYSDSPKWKEHIECSFLPKFPGGAVILNWSHRSSWGRSFPVLVFYHFAGQKEFCPIGLIFRFGRPVRRFRFFEPFNDLKH